MRMSFGLETRQKQEQRLSPRMIQSMEVLQMGEIELQERVEKEISENPTLEVDVVDPTLPDEQQETVDSDQPTDNETELVVDADNNASDDFERLLNMDQEFPDYFNDGPRPSTNRIEQLSDRRHDTISNIDSRPTSLNDDLLRQLGELQLDPQIRTIAELIISSLAAEDGGYFRTSLADLLPADTPADQLATAEQALAVVQRLHPRGIAARDLSECLLAQVDADHPDRKDISTLIHNHLDDLRDNRLPQIARTTGMTLERIQQVTAELSKLNPKPGATFVDHNAPVVKPDIDLEQQEDGSYLVVILDTWLPRLSISKYYRQRLEDPEASREEKDYIKKKIMGSQWLIEAIEQRRTTLKRVAQAIVDYQQDFLDHGPEHINPLKMQQIADMVGRHVTTVSRAVDDKWMQTPRGIFSLKRFFGGGTVSADGEDVAYDRIRIKLQEIVDAEDKSKPHSDDELVRQLASHGMKVARRTITKYRKKMGIPSSRQRKDWTAPKQNP
ncbi:MAG: RNA polymerase factor sigma-54 [Pirellulaceae bacterium]|nr:RNA polymerase factor sigma-54 [Pirellulaceae bacterium]